MEVRFWNRTMENAKTIAKDFDIKLVKDLNDILKTEVECNMVIVGTIPAQAQESLDFSMFTFPSQYKNGIIIEMAYRPRETPLIVAAKNCTKNWALVEGIQVLLEQGFEQFRIWTGKKAPKE